MMLKNRNDPPNCAVLIGPSPPEPLRCRPPRVMFVDWHDEEQLASFLAELARPRSEAAS